MSQAAFATHEAFNQWPFDGLRRAAVTARP